ncbi:MAG: ATP-binding protein [Candidatus Pseudomonas phytovorans]|uniref:histidine kinase n=1 Tax=Candidatus Pseudomonas phytovorans TaxID=3121377 RepID=A0AAJ6B9I2_9PSED|nr:ATP-binding protein [Pseudomonas sp.]WEK28192.1 MAG: ATP-binding protein [Pseudomonas sp.]
MSNDCALAGAEELQRLHERIAYLEQHNHQLQSALASIAQRMQEADRYRFLFENMEEGFCIIQFVDGPHGRLSDYVHLMANPAYCRHAGLTHVVGRRLREVIPEEAQVWLNYFGTVERTGEPLYFEHELLATDRCLGLAAIRIEPAEDHLVAVIFRDVTARKQAEDALRALNEDLEERVAHAVAKHQKAEAALQQAQKLEAVGQLTGGLAHDLNNLLGGVLGALELARCRVTDEHQTATLPALLGSAHDAAHRAAALIHRLLAFSRQQTLQPCSTNVSTLVSGMLELISRTIGPHITLGCSPNEAAWTVRIDPPQLESALLNLCINARDALPAGGRIRITLDNLSIPADRAQPLDLAPGEYLCLSVEDNGRGMADDVRARAVDPFFTTKPLGQGTGLGLSMVYGFVRQSGGQLQIESAQGQGTRVSMFLPRHHAQPVPRLPGPETPAPSLAASSVREIVVVEDVGAMRLVIAEALHDLGHRVKVFEDGPMALAGMAGHPRPDLLISDVGLPGGINGRQLADRLRLSYPGLKVLFVTGYDEHAVLGDGTLEEGMSVLTKPFTLPALATRVSQMLEA